MITKEMLNRCQNELKQAFCALPEDVQNAIKSNQGYAEWLKSEGNGLYVWARQPLGEGCANLPTRLSPDTPTEPEWEERVVKFEDGIRSVWFKGLGSRLWVVNGRVAMTACVGHERFLGIIYLKDGIENMRTSVDAAFGTPVRVRFAKEVK